MRALNHAHIFEIPLSDRGPDLDALTPGLQAVADDLRRDRSFVERVTALGRLYLDDGPACCTATSSPAAGCGLAVACE